MAAGAAVFPDLLALGDGTAAFRQPLEIGAHVDIPGLDFSRRGGTAYGLPRRVGRLRQQAGAQQRGGGEDSFFHQLTCTLETSPFGDTCQDWMALL